MLSVDEFLEAVEAQGLVPEPILQRLRRKLSGGTSTPSAAAAADFLVQAGAITAEQADEILRLEARELELVEEKKPSAEEDAPEVIYTDVVVDGLPEQSLEPDAPVRSSRRKHLKTARSSEFDSPWFLIGGGALALLALLGGGLVFLIGRGSGDEAFRSAQEAYEAGSLQQAIARFEQFVEDYPTHSDYSLARVRLTMARIRQALDTATNPKMALEIAEEEVPLIEDEPAFGEERTELAALLPRIALGLAERADRSSRDGDGTAAIESAAGAQTALGMIANTKYVPKSFREESELAEIRALLGRVERRAQAIESLDRAKQRIADAIASGDLADAYRAHAEFVMAYPDLADNAGLREALERAAQAEQAAATFVEERAPAETGPAPSPVERSVAIINRLTSGSAPTDGVFVAQAGGLAYGVNAADGRFLWRRPVGVSLYSTPATTTQAGLLLVDHRRQELVLLEPTTGEERWRASLPDTGSRPVVVGDRLLVTTATGEVLALDAASGERLGRVKFAQPITTSVMVDRANNRLYAVGEQASLYCLDATTLDCVSVSMLAHGPESIVSPPVLVDSLLVLFENVGLQTARMRVFRREANGALGEELQTARLSGAVIDSAVVAGRKLIVATTAGEVSLFELTADPERAAVTLLAKRDGAGADGQSRSIAYHRRAVWIAEDRLMKGEASLTNTRLVAQPMAVDFGGDRFVGPLAARDGVVLHARKPKGREGLIAGATDAESGEVLWETELAATPLGAPSPVTRPAGLLAISNTGRASVVGRDDVNAMVSPAPEVTVQRSPGLPSRFVDRTEVARGRIVLSAPGYDRFAAIAIGPRSASVARRLPGKLATRPVALSGGWLAPLSLGQVLLLDATGKPLASPFQPPLTPGVEVNWSEPAAGSMAGQDLALLCDRIDTVYAVQRSADGNALELAGSHRFAGSQPVGPLAIVGEHALVGLSGGVVGVAPLPSLRDPVPVKLDSQIAWGPFAVGPAEAPIALMATEANELVAMAPDNARVLWRRTVEAAQLLGEPVNDDDTVVIGLAPGVLERVMLSDGAALRQINLGQPLGSGPIVTGSRLVVAATDGALLVVPVP